MVTIVLLYARDLRRPSPRYLRKLCFLLLELCAKSSILVLQFNDLLPQLVQISFLVLDFLLELHISLAICLCLLHPSLHLLYQLSKLPVLLIFLQECFVDLSILCLHLAYHCISLQEFLFYYFQLLRVCKCVLAFDDFLKLVPKSGALIHVKLHFDLNLGQSSATDVSFQGVYFFLSQ